MRSSHLRNFQTAISLEVHRISDRPDLFWQQVYNRLQWSGELASGPLLYELEKRTAPGAPPWIRTRMPYRESRYLARTLFGHSGTVNCCAISPDGMSIISGGEDYSVKVWDAATGRLRFDLREHGGPVRACAIGHDGRTFVSGDAEGKLCIWEMASGHLQERLSAGRQEIHGLAVSPKDGLIAAACADGRLRIWDPLRRSLVAEWAGHKGPVYCCRFAPDGDLIISSGDDGPLIAWRLSKPGEVVRLSEGAARGVRCCALSPSGQFAAGLSSEAGLTVWELTTGKAVGQAFKSAGHHPWYWGASGRAGVMGCAIHPGERWAVAPAYDKTLSVWEISTGEEVVALEGHTGWVKDCAIGPDGSFCVSAATDGTLLIWDLTAITGVEASKPLRHYQPVKGCAFTPDGSRAVSTCEDKNVSVSIWDLASNTEIDRFRMPQSNGLLACAIASDGRWVATTSTDNTVAVRDLRSKEMVATLYGHELLAYPYFGTFGCAFSPRGKLLVSAGGDKTLSLWTTENWKKAGTLSGHEDRVMACVFSPDGKTVISAGFDHTVRSWDVDRLSQVLVLKDHRGPVYCCAVSPDGRTLLSGGGGGIVTKDFKVRLWDARNGDLIAALAGHRAPVRACAFTPDGVYFVTAGEDGIFRVWESAGGKSAAEIDLGGKLYSAAIHPWRLHAGCGDQGGNFQLLDLLGIESGPIVITAHDLGGGPRFRCPACGSVAGARREWLGAVIACPSGDCGQSLRLNPFLSST